MMPMPQAEAQTVEFECVHKGGVQYQNSKKHRDYAKYLQVKEGDMVAVNNNDIEQDWIKTMVDWKEYWLPNRYFKRAEGIWVSGTGEADGFYKLWGKKNGKLWYRKNDRRGEGEIIFDPRSVFNGESPAWEMRCDGVPYYGAEGDDNVAPPKEGWMDGDEMPTSLKIDYQTSSPAKVASEPRASGPEYVSEPKETYKLKLVQFLRKHMHMTEEHLNLAVKRFMEKYLTEEDINPTLREIHGEDLRSIHL